MPLLKFRPLPMQLPPGGALQTLAINPKTNIHPIKGESVPALPVAQQTHEGNRAPADNGPLPTRPGRGLRGSSFGKGSDSGVKPKK